MFVLFLETAHFPKIKLFSFWLRLLTSEEVREALNKHSAGENTILVGPVLFKNPSTRSLSEWDTKSSILQNGEVTVYGAPSSPELTYYTDLGGQLTLWIQTLQDQAEI
uniref:Uncharacterized protein n=1 Tax=Mus musculus TaxID=10090 RepID=Q8C1V2_MOUSE|nr:unnamed protein product [Mus musculus]